MSSRLTIPMIGVISYDQQKNKPKPHSTSRPMFLPGVVSRPRGDIGDEAGIVDIDSTNPTEYARHIEVGTNLRGR